MKTILSLLLALTFASPACPAQERQPTVEHNLYYRALVATLAARAEDSKYAKANDPLDHVIIQSDIQLNNGGSLHNSFLTNEWTQRSALGSLPHFGSTGIANICVVTGYGRKSRWVVSATGNPTIRCR